MATISIFPGLSIEQPFWIINLGNKLNINCDTRTDAFASQLNLPQQASLNLTDTPKYTKALVLYAFGLGVILLVNCILCHWSD